MKNKNYTQAELKAIEHTYRRYSNYVKRSANGSVVNGLDTDSKVIVNEKALNTISTIVHHKENVRKRLMYLASEIQKRAETHDDSKLEYPEIIWQIEMDEEPRYPYGSEEYFDKVKRWEKFFKHHYEHNRHHPDHYEAGLAEFDIVDLCEFMIDITAYFDQIHPADAISTIDKQFDRFGLNETLQQILKNTLLHYYTWTGPFKPQMHEGEGNES